MLSSIAYLLGIVIAVTIFLNLLSAKDSLKKSKKDEKKGETADKVYQPVRANPIDFSRDRDLLFFLQRIRDEAHRFAITFHRNRRRADFIESILDTVSGIGKQRKKILLKHFGSIKKIRAAPLEELSSLPGINDKIARSIKAKLSG